MRLGLLLGLVVPVLVRSDLGQFALQKILRDARDVLGDIVENATTTNSARANWMATYPDETPLTAMNIPGLHDAATWNYSQSTQDALRGATRCDGNAPGPARVYRCQRVSLLEALEAGIRFFDLRFAMDTVDARLVFWHGSALVSARAEVGDVFMGVYGWLEGHKGEVVLVSLQYEKGTREGVGSDAVVQGLLVDVLTSPAARVWIHQGRNVLPRLGEVRGKVFLVRRFDLDFLPGEVEADMPGIHLSPRKWVDNGRDFELVFGREGEKALIEDYFYPGEFESVEGNIRAKFEVVEGHLRKAAAAAAKGEGDKEGDGLWITFTSATHVDAVPPVYPDVMALGKRRRHGVLGVNYRLLELLGQLRGERLGVVVMDFFEEPGDLVGALLAM